MTEQEEFEFRHRFEQEQAAQSAPAQVAPQAAPEPQDKPGRWDGLSILAGLSSLAPVSAALGIPVDAKQLNDAGGGVVRGVGSLAATAAAPFDSAKDALAGRGLSLESNRQRRSDMDEKLRAMGADPDSLMYQGGKLASEIGLTFGTGGALAKGAQALGASPSLVSSLSSGGLNVAGRTGLGGAATRVAGGALTGGATAGLVNPENAGTGAVVGGTIPGVASAAGKAGRAIGRAVRGGEVSPAVVDLANKAKGLGIDVPADRIVNSKPMNALAASLEYMPLSGRTATLDKVQNQFNRAITRTFGQDSDNVTMALRQAQDELGSKFDDVLKNNAVKMDQPFMDELATHAQRAGNELELGQANIITKQIDEIMAKVKDGKIDGQAAYNIKKTLDRIGQRNSPEAWYANDLKKSLMGVLNRSLSPEDAAAFAKTRQQYGTMLDLKKLAQNGADGDISIARVANMKNIGNPELQDLADISAQFLKSREGQHGAMQRIMLGGLGAAGAGSGLVSPLLFGGAVAAGRGANSALNSNALRNLLLRPPGQGRGLLSYGAEKSNKVLPLLVPQVVSDQ